MGQVELAGGSGCQTLSLPGTPAIGIPRCVYRLMEMHRQIEACTEERSLSFSDAFQNRWLILMLF